MQRCKTCGREFTTNQTMTYSVYGYCSWDCLMNKKARGNNQNQNQNQNRNNRKNHNSNRTEPGHRARWA